MRRGVAYYVKLFVLRAFARVSVVVNNFHIAPYLIYYLFYFLGRNFLTLAAAVCSYNCFLI